MATSDKPKPLPHTSEQLANTVTSDKPKPLPYASEPFGVYQPLIGWRSQLQHERLSSAIASRVLEASNFVSRVVDKPTAVTVLRRSNDPTGTKVGQAVAAHVNTGGAINVAKFIGGHEEPLLNRVLGNQAPDNEAAVATVLQYLEKRAPLAAQAMFRPRVTSLDRTVASAALFSDKQPAQSVFLSPIGILHLFREYFFEMGSFLGPPVGHVWISPGGTLELVESNTRRTVRDLTVEDSIQTTSKTEFNTTDKDELSDAVKSENANDTKLGASATASGGVGSVFHASGTASFNLDDSRKQAQEQTHKKMREQSAKLSSEVRQNFKTTFRTVTETNDTSSRRYVLANNTGALVSYELSRKMRKVSVQVQDLGQRLCWQLYVDNPGDPLGIGEFVHATADALDPSLKIPDTIPYPPNQQINFPSAIPFILFQGADHGAEDTYTTSPEDGEHGIFSPDIGKNDIIQFKHEIKCPPTPAGFILVQVTNINFHGARAKWNPDLALDVTNEKFTILLTYANFGGNMQMPFDATLVYEPTADAKAIIDKKNNESKTQYDDQLAAAKEKLLYDTLRKRMKLVGQVQSRLQSDLREEERNVIYRSIVSRLYGNEDGWADQDYHVASEMIRYFFDIDAMLYFVAQDWWRPRTQQLSPFNINSKVQSTIIAEPAVTARIKQVGKRPQFAHGHRPYYMVTEETARAAQGASLGWLLQIDGDTHRNAFLNSPWVKAVVPIRPGKEREAIAFLQRPEAADTDGLEEPYPFDAASDPPDYRGLTVKEVLLKVADRIAGEYKRSLVPVRTDPQNINSKLALPTETVFAKGYDPLEGGIAFNNGAFKVFSEWTEVLPTDQVVATEYSLKGL